MTSNAQSGKFTGKHMVAIFVFGFGIVAAVNFYMASLATGGFHGIVVENSYVASQKFNGWLEEAEQARQLGWEASAARDEDGFVELTTNAVPANAIITAELRRPLGEREYASLRFGSLGDGTWRSVGPIAAGRWIVRLRIEAAGEVWSEESELK